MRRQVTARSGGRDSPYSLETETMPLGEGVAEAAAALAEALSRLAKPLTDLAKTLAEHDGVDALWVAGSAEISTMVEKASVTNLKQTWTTRGLYYDLSDADRFGGDYLLQRATQVKNVWIPYGA